MEKGLEHRMSSVMSQQFENAGGVSSVAEILNVIDRATERSLLENLAQEDPELVEEIRRLMFVFEDITKLRDKDIQTVLKNVESSQWAMALKGASEELKQKILGNMSKRAAAAAAGGNGVPRPRARCRTSSRSSSRSSTSSAAWKTPARSRTATSERRARSRAGSQYMATTPMMQQYHDAKAACGDALLLFRMGDFYELFFDDAKTAARVLGLTLTSRDKGENPIPMAGFPYHQLDGYLGKIIAAGYRAAICEQVEDPKLAKGLVKREVTRVVTPGTLTDDALLDPRESNFLAAVAYGVPRSKDDEPEVGMAWADFSTGRFFAAVFPARQLADELMRIGPSECLLADDAPPLPDYVARACMITRRPAWAFSHETAHGNLTKFFETASLEGFGFTRAGHHGHPRGGRDPRLPAGNATHLARSLRSAGAVPCGPVPGNRRIDAPQSGNHAHAPRRPPRRFAAGRDRPDHHAMGSRLLADWVAAPLTQRDAIEARLDAVEELVRESRLRASLRDELKGIYDIERLLSRVATGRASPRDLSFIGRTLRSCRPSSNCWPMRTSALLRQLEAELDPCQDLRDQTRRGPGRRMPADGQGWRDHSPRLSRRTGPFPRTGGGRQTVDRPVPGAGDRADRHSQAEGRLQQGLWLLHRGLRRRSSNTSRTTTSASRRSRTPNATSRRS